MTNPQPKIVFKVNLGFPGTNPNTPTAKIGPNTNARQTACLQPDMYQSNEDTGRTNSNNQPNNFVSFLPGFLGATNVEHLNGTQFTAYGQQAVYLKNTYTTGTAPLLTVVSEVDTTT